MSVPAREGVHDTDPGAIEGAEDDSLVHEGDPPLDLGRREQLGILAPRLRGGEPALELLQALGGARHLDPAALGEDAQLPILAHALLGEPGHFL
jgi:hypothetical protein